MKNKNKSALLKIILAIVIALIFFLLIKQNYNQRQIIKNQNIESTNNTKTTFSNKQECIKYKDAIESKMSKTEWTKYVIEQIFYSEIENSCFYSVFAYKDKSSILNESYNAYMIWDYLSDNLIFYRDTTLTNGDNLEEIYKNTVNYLQGKEPLKYSKEKWILD